VIEAFDGQVAVRFPPGAADEPLLVTVRLPSAEALPASGTLSPFAFEVVAEGEASGQAVHQFQESLEITVRYEEEWLQGHEDSLFLFYFDEEAAGWIPLPSQVHTETNTLIGTSDHLTVFDINEQDWQAATLPTLAGFQVAGFTGAAQYS
jgi:hypothetical protein